jgi:hypothetical protein
MNCTRLLAACAAVALACGCAPESSPPRPDKPPEPVPPDSAQEGTVRELDRIVEPGHLLRAFEIEELRQRGLAEPISEIVASLQAHPEVIPFPGVLGGRMGFHSPAQIHVLNTSWVYADFDDGHVAGHGVFGYSIQADGSLEWRTVMAVLD